MEMAVGRPLPVATARLSAELPKLSIHGGRFAAIQNPWVFANNGFCPFCSMRISPRFKKPMIVAAKKDNKKNEKKVDTHSFVPKPDEATGPFPEAVLLKEKKVQEDGRLLPEFADAEEQELFEQLNLELESDLGVEQMRHYEVVYLIHEDHDKEVESVNLKVQDFIKEKNGKIWRFSDWGVRRLAYKIKKAKNAHYILMNFELAGNWINDFKTMFDKDDRVIRHLVMKRDTAETEDCPPPPEFHALRGGMDEDDDYDEYDVDDEDDGVDWVEGEANKTASASGNETEEGIMYMEDYIDVHKESRNSNRPNNVNRRGRIKQRPMKVRR